MNIPITRCPDDRIRLGLHIGVLKTDDGKRMGSISMSLNGQYVEIALDGRGRYEIDVIEAARDILREQGPCPPPPKPSSSS